ncbi:MAG TPA: ATP-binding protein [Nitrospiraceae bacterium]|jgi:signal transduction histidine kinase/CHASE3 domain sensor protein|nr:ATP-binding protein [Nitrospiraceae bacterium]
MSKTTPTSWWSSLRVQQKVWTILLAVFVPLVAALVVQVTLVNELLTVQRQHQQIVTARQQILILRRLAVDIEDAFRGYLLTRQEEFLKPMIEAEPKIQPAVDRALSAAANLPDMAADIQRASERLGGLLDSKQALVRQIKAGEADAALRYVKSGKGLALADTLRQDFRMIEDRLESELEKFEINEEDIAERAFWGLLLAVVGGMALGLVGSRLLTQSITGPLGVLGKSVTALNQLTEQSREVPIAIHSSDEIGHLARSFEEMARRIRRHIRELETINAIGHEINVIGADGLGGVLRRITDRAAELLQVDVCLVMLRNEQMGCWIVEAASGEWHDRLHETVMLWEEFPVSVQAFEMRGPAIGENLRGDPRPEVERRNVIGESMLAIPLLSRGVPFGVLAFLQNRAVSRDDWNLRLAKGFADEAAIAIANARLYEAVHLKEKGLESRLRQLEHLAETMAHDMKAPGERMEGLAAVLLTEYEGKLDERATRWLRLIEQNGKELMDRVENILEVARVGAGGDAVEAVSPAPVINEVLKARAGELEARRVRVQVREGLPMVACHRAYLYQVIDNLVSNAIKFSGERPDPEIRITAERTGDRVQFTVTDNGIGIPSTHRERVFEPFVRVNQDSAKGSGIGLAIVKRVIELYGGRVWIEPNLPSGCSVRFTLPVLGELSVGDQARGAAMEAARREK